MSARRARAAALFALAASACSGGGGPPATGAPATGTAAPPPVVTTRPVRKSIDGVLLPAADEFGGIVAVPAAATPKSADPRNGIYDLTGPFDDAIAFYQRHHPDAARSDLPNGVKLIVTPAGGDYYTIRLIKVAFERTRIMITATPRFPAGGTAAP